jgi:3-oxoacyl-[acyl-carrier protein] reductase
MTDIEGVLPDETAVVTGASTGIGRAIAKRLAEAGANVVVCSRSGEEIRAVADEITAADSPGRAYGVACDVTESTDVAALVKAAVDRFGGIDVLVPNAGGMLDDDNLHRIDEEVFAANVDVNLIGQFRTVKAALPVMIDGGGSIVFMGTVNALTGIGLTGYTAAKGGVLSLCRLVAAQYGRHGIRANVVSPGTIKTEARADEMEADEQRDERSAREEWLDQYPLGRFGRPEEVADATLFLASERSSFVTGTTLVVDGGLTAGLDQGFHERVYDADDLSSEG